MSDTKRFALLDLILLVLVVAAAGGTRAWYLVTCADAGAVAAALQVQDAPPKWGSASTGAEGAPPANELEALVENLKEGRGFVGPAPFAAKEEPTAHIAPGYPYFVALAQRLPLNIVPLERLVRWLQCGLGALTAGFYFLFARRAFRNRVVAGLAGLLTALHPFWIVSTAQVNDGVLATFLLALCVWLGTRGGQEGGAFTSLLYGLALAALALTRAALLPFAFVAVLWYLYRCRTVPRGWLAAFLALLGFVNGLVPWTLRNYQVFNDVLPVVDSAYLHLWMGNNPRAGGGRLTEQEMLDALAEWRGENVQAVAGELGALRQPERYGRLARPTWDVVRGDPAGTMQRRLSAGLAFFFGDKWLNERRLWELSSGDEPPMPAWLAGSFPALLSGALLGMLLMSILGWRWSSGWRWEAMPSSLALVWVPLPYLLSHAEALHGPRLPLDGVLLTYAAFAFACVIPTVGGPLLKGSDPGSQQPSP